LGKTSARDYEVVIIGAGMSGLAAGIRLAMFGKKVLILERHNAPGGLNSFYSIAGRKYDVGLHAMTNYVPAGVKKTPLGKIFRQLRIPREAFELRPQKQSRIAIPGCELVFTNDFAVLEAGVADAFPLEIDGFRRLAAHIREYDETSLDNPVEPARAIVQGFIKDPVLEDMLFLPLMYYGSAQEHDMDFAQFAIMFKALFFEGFARPPEGVRTIIRALTQRYRELGGERKMKLGVRQLKVSEGRVRALLLDDGSEITARCVLSSIGLAETERLYHMPPAVATSKVGRLSFVETITVTDELPVNFGWDDTIVFFNARERFHYAQPADLVDTESGVICLPNNYAYEAGEGLTEGFFRLTALANYKRWRGLPEAGYRAAKADWFATLRHSALRFLPNVAPGHLESSTLATDMFTPRTIERYTGHLGGAVYGAPQKSRRGLTDLDNLFLCGTDQGFLGITGAMLSGISMANLHCLVE